MDCNTIYCSNAITGDDSVVLVPNRAIKTLDNTGSYHLVICCNATAKLTGKADSKGLTTPITHLVVSLDTKDE